MRPLLIALVIASLTVTSLSLALRIRDRRGVPAPEQPTRWPPPATVVLCGTHGSLDLLVRPRAEDPAAWRFLDERLAAAVGRPGHRFLELVIQNRGDSPVSLEGLRLELHQADGATSWAEPLRGEVPPAVRPYLGAFPADRAVPPGATRRLLLEATTLPALDGLASGRVLGRTLAPRPVAVERLLEAVVSGATPLIASLTEESDR